VYCVVVDYGDDGYSHGYNDRGSYGSASYSYQRNTGGYSGDSRSSHEPPQGSGWEYTLRMRGVPYSTEEKDVYDFFHPVVPTKMDIELDSYDRPSGLAFIGFASLREAEDAMKNDRKNLGEPHSSY